MHIMITHHRITLAIFVASIDKQQFYYTRPKNSIKGGYDYPCLNFRSHQVQPWVCCLLCFCGIPPWNNWDFNTLKQKTLKEHQRHNVIYLLSILKVLTAAVWVVTIHICITELIDVNWSMFLFSTRGWGFWVFSLKWNDFIIFSLNKTGRGQSFRVTLCM